MELVASLGAEQQRKRALVQVAHLLKNCEPLGDRPRHAHRFSHRRQAVAPVALQRCPGYTEPARYGPF
jgi:hypothetical protein